MSTEKIKQQLAARSDAPQPAGRTVYDLLEKQKPQIAAALPKSMSAERFARIVLTECRRTPRLLGCTPESLLGAVMLSAQLGLEPGPLGHVYFVPFRNGRTKQTEVQFIIGYKGLIDLARRSGNITSIIAREVCEGDEFEFEYGLEERLVHRPALTDRGQPIAYYGVARYRDGGHTMLVMSLDEIEKRRGRSKAKDDGPWVTDPTAMSLKTVIRAMASYLPLSIEAARAVLADEVVTTELGPDVLDGITEQEIDATVDAEAREIGDGEAGGGEATVRSDDSDSAVPASPPAEPDEGVPPAGDGDGDPAPSAPTSRKPRGRSGTARHLNPEQ